MVVELRSQSINIVPDERPGYIALIVGDAEWKHTKVVFDRRDADWLIERLREACSAAELAELAAPPRAEATS